MIKNFVFLGAPGVGKGTMATVISKEKGIVHISTGDILRKHIKDETKIGIVVKEILSSGGYVPDEIVNNIVKERLLTKDVQENGFILDGYPRTINQAEFLEKIFDKEHLQVVLLKTNEEIIRQRLSKRALEENRKDDSSQVVHNRITIYNKLTAPLINYYKDKKQLIEIDVEGTVVENVNVFYKGCTSW